MLSEESIKKISFIFCGDVAGFYSYKRGSDLVSFFNQYFNYKDHYGQGFPSRWMYVYNKIVDMINIGTIDSFFSLILGKEYIMRDIGITEVKAAETSEKIMAEFNKILRQDLFRITYNNNRFHLVAENEDLVLIGSGGFANVYRRKSTGLIVKKLKDDFLTDKAICSRFKREYKITKSLQNTSGIIKVYDFDDGNCSYTMEEAEKTLEKFVKENDLLDSNRLNCIYQLLSIMTEVHKKDIIHRDISPNNIFVISGELKIADFGLGKDLNVFTSHQTIHTNAVGQYYYCAPEQFMMLRDADKRSDVYSIGRVINFVMTGRPDNSNHPYKSVAEKATDSDVSYRYNDASQLFYFFRKAVQYQRQLEDKERLNSRIQSGVFDEEIESYIYNMSADSISKAVMQNQSGFTDILIKFMHINETHAEHIIKSINNSFREVCGKSFEANDPFANFAYRILTDSFSYKVKEIAANILRYVATEINRFSAQRLVENLLSDEIEPMLQDILNS